MGWIDRHGNVRSLGAQWNQSRESQEIYLKAGPEEKAAALDAAIEFEDEMATHLGTKGLTMADEGTGMGMAPVDELLEIGARMKRDKLRLLDLCRQIGGSDVEPAADAQPPRRGGPRKGKAVSKVPPKRGGGLGRESLPGKPEYWKKVTCTVCGQTKGTRIEEGGKRYPVLHKNPETDEPCQGCFQAVSET